MSMRQRRLAFVFAPDYATNGSTIMRGQQLAEIVRANGVREDVSFRKVTPWMRNTDVFFTKGAAKFTPEKTFQRLKSFGNRILIDPVDEEVFEVAGRYADVIVAASHAAKVEFEQTHPQHRVVQVDHHVDPRVRALTMPTARPAWKAGYFGELFNTVQSPHIDAMVDFHSVSTAHQASPWFDDLPPYSFHYGVRARMERDRHKPFLKGFTAAACGAPILVQESEAEPMHWVGADYPFVIRGESTEAAIVAGLEHARDAFGSKEWATALDVMADIEERTSDARIAAQVREALDA